MVVEGQSRLLSIRTDITKLDVDAIVNAANNALLGGGGVDGAIHQVAGPELLKACAKLSGCATGEAKITPGFELPAKYVIHTVGPIWSDGHSNEDQFLLSCYERCLDIAATYHLTTLAFPAISCGVYGYPIALATKIAVSSVAHRLTTNDEIEQVTFACFNNEAHDHYEREISLIEHQLQHSSRR